MISAANPPPLFTVGHSNQTLAEFTGLLAAVGVAVVVDVRKLTGSRAQPQFNDDLLAQELPRVGMAYRQLDTLGGRRPVSRDVSREVNGLWRNRSFQNYADWALSREFREGLDQLREWGHEAPTAVMCSEAVWWRCHRRIIADHLLAHGEAVFHIMAGPKSVPAELTPGAKIVAGTSVVYPAE